MNYVTPHHSPPSSAEVQNEQSCTSTPHNTSCCEKEQLAVMQNDLLRDGQFFQNRILQVIWSKKYLVNHRSVGQCDIVTMSSELHH
jgi:hypothetical protein